MKSYAKDPKTGGYLHYIYKTFILIYIKNIYSYC